MPGLVELCESLGFAPQHIYAVVAQSDGLYVDAQIPKKGRPGEFRVIRIPSLALKGIQKQILKSVLSNMDVHDAAFAYVPNRNIVDAANRLAGGKAVLRIDIRDFFPSISENRIFGFFSGAGFDAQASHVLTKLCTHQGSLPQGAPSSPALSNLIFKPLDQHLTEMAHSWELEYTRYCDDLFFAHQRNFNHPRFLQMCRTAIADAGFDINDQKTKYHARGVPRKTLGLLTHGSRPALPGSTRKRIRTAFYRGSRNINWGQENAEFLRGMLQWYKCVYGRDPKYYEYERIIQTITKVKLHVSYRSQ